jgi:hypothetical protein
MDVPRNARYKTFRKAKNYLSPITNDAFHPATFRDGEFQNTRKEKISRKEK